MHFCFVIIRKKEKAHFFLKEMENGEKYVLSMRMLNTMEKRICHQSIKRIKYWKPHKTMGNQFCTVQKVDAFNEEYNTRWIQC